METTKSLSTSEGAAIEEAPKDLHKKRNRLVTHLFVAPMALLVFICVFIHQCVIIPTVWQLLFCLVAMILSIFMLERGGRRQYHALKNEEGPEHRQATKKLLAYYAGFLIIVFLTMAIGSYLNTHFLDEDKAVRNQTHFEQIFRIDTVN